MPESQPTKEIPALRCATAGMNDWLAANSEVIIPCANWPVVSAYGPYSGVMWRPGQALKIGQLIITFGATKTNLCQFDNNILICKGILNSYLGVLLPLR